MTTAFPPPTSGPPGDPPSAVPVEPVRGVKYQLVADRIGMDPAQWINAVRHPTGKPQQSYRDIAPRLSKLADVYVSHESVRRWHQSSFPNAPDDAPDTINTADTTTEEHAG